MGINNILGAVLSIVLLYGTASAQENRYMVFFKDKAGTPYSLANPVEFLSQKAIERRMERGADITAQDLPVPPSYVQGVRSLGIDVFFTTRWLNGVLIQTDPSKIDAVEGLPYVDHVEFVAPLPKLQSGGRLSFNLHRKRTLLTPETDDQLKMIGMDLMHQADYTGRGVTIAILDSGFPGVNVSSAFADIFSEGRFNDSVSYDFVHNSPDVFQHDDHGTEVLSVIGAQIPDGFTGGAFDANFQLFITEDVPSEYRIEEYNWLFAAERADSAGADIIQSSLGYYDFDDASMNYTRDEMDGKTTVVSRAAQWAADRGILVIVSAGNEGNIPSWRIITAPADAQDVLAIGAVDSHLQKSSISSIGPSADNRIKPDLAALGVGVKVVKPNGQLSAASGTSLAAPLVTSLAAGVLQRYPELTNLEVISLFAKTSSQAAHPDNLLGYGIPNFQAIVNYHEFVPQEKTFEIFPNPLADDTLTISPFDPNLVASCKIEILSAQGQLLTRDMARFDWLNRVYRADMSGLAAGIYYIRVLSEKSRHTFKLVKL